MRRSACAHGAAGPDPSGTKHARATSTTCRTWTLLCCCVRFAFATDTSAASRSFALISAALALALLVESTLRRDNNLAKAAVGIGAGANLFASMYTVDGGSLL